MQVSCIVFAPDGLLLASASADKTICLLEASTGGLTLATSAPGLGLPSSHICTGTWAPLQPHLHRDGAQSPTTAPGLGPPLPHHHQDCIDRYRTRWYTVGRRRPRSADRPPSLQAVCSVPRAV